MRITDMGTDGRTKLVEVVVSWDEYNGKKDYYREEVVKAVVVDTRPF
jgi:hypothetical protein